MNIILIRVVDGKLLLSATLGSDGKTRDVDLVEFKHPFNDAVLEEIRWYLEDFLQFPYGINQEKAKRVADKMKVLGSEFFQNTFNSSENVSKLYEEAVESGLDKCEINISSDDPLILKLPWELLHDPERGQLSLFLSAIYRSPRNLQIRESVKPASINQLNILIVTARPRGEEDVAYGMVARPMLDAVKHLGGKVHVKLLRPPTLQALGDELDAHPGHYQVVHFDCHGEITKNGPLSRCESKGPQGALLFETIEGKAQKASATDVCKNLGSGIPLFVLNACKSAEHGDDPWSSVASQLLKSGATAVVAMAYSVCASTARSFMTWFYTELVAGKSVSEAVRRGREAIHSHSLRASPKGNLKLEDWVVPVLYLHRKCAPFALLDSGVSREKVSRTLATTESHLPMLTGFPNVSRYGFIGREMDMLRLEKHYRTHEIVVIQSMGGMGKTELACGFARWLLETNGRSQAYYTSFENGAKLEDVVNQVGLACTGERFNSFPSERRQQVVEDHLCLNECLLVLDNFESVSGHRSDTERMLTDVERVELSEFLQGIVGGESWVLITSRGEEEWLGFPGLLNLGGLVGADVTEFAKEVFAKADIDVKGLSSEYLDLVKMLDGHPLSLRVVLPRLKDEEAKELMAGLEQGLKKLDANSDQRSQSLSASLEYSFGKLSQRAKEHLPFLCLFRGRAHAGVLGMFSHGSSEDEDSLEGEGEKVYEDVFKEKLNGDGWTEVLDEALSSGILETVSQRFFRIHPTLPWFLKQQLETICEKREREAGVGDGFERLERQLIRIYKSIAGYHFMLLKTSYGGTALHALAAEEPNLLHQLRRAEHFLDWDSSQFILQALNELYKRRNQSARLAGLRDRTLQCIGQSSSVARSKGKDALTLWAFLKTNEAHSLLYCRKLEEAVMIYWEVLQLTIEAKDKKGNADSFHNLGNIYKEQRLFEEAKVFYQVSLKIREEISDTQGIAASHNQLGNMATKQGKLAEAEKCYRKALMIHKDAGDIYESAWVRHNLGVVEQELAIEKLEEAKKLFLEASKIREKVGDLPLAATDYHHVGKVAYLQRQPGEARKYYKRALKIFEDRRSLGEAASPLHGLGLVARDEGRLGDAIALLWRSRACHKNMEAEEDNYGGPESDLATLLAKIGEGRFRKLWEENIEEACRDSFVERLRSIDPA